MIPRVLRQTVPFHSQPGGHAGPAPASADDTSPPGESVRGQTAGSGAPAPQAGARARSIRRARVLARDMALRGDGSSPHAPGTARAASYEAARARVRHDASAPAFTPPRTRLDKETPGA